ncbi:MAG: hydantoinase/oxoprolinase family protein, partial [Cyclobacteriaceae bacterium]|nr:hydantoinase/oxoprolinase family protein [Cyclobacteriaceae bacterium]
MSWKLWIDTGGTFTDCIGFTPGDEIKQFKVLSSSCLRGNVIKIIDHKSLQTQINWPLEDSIFQGYNIRFLETGKTFLVDSIDPKTGIVLTQEAIPNDLKGFFEITANEEVPVLAARILTATPLNKPLPEIELRLGSTKGTNALLERKGAKTALILNAGFEDLLEIGTQQRPDIFALNIKKRKKYYSEVFGLKGRQDKTGETLIPFQEQEWENLSSKLLKGNFESIAVSFIHSYKNNTQEHTLKKQLNAKGIGHISISSEISNSVKYLDRTETTVINAYLDPIIKGYVEGIAEKINGDFHIMTSAGGIVDAHNFLPKDSLLSGPAGGIVGAANSAKLSGFKEIITLDMGGTSTDVAIYPGFFDYQYTTEVNEALIQAPSLAIDTIAAGGGSLISFDGYTLKVGPESAGARPGPACYGDGGKLTVTDVNLLLGRVHPDVFSIPLHIKDSLQALNILKEQMLSVNPTPIKDSELLLAIITIANEMMAEAIRKISLRKGHDPTTFALLAFGGAGGQHACGVAEILGIKKIIIPYQAGVLSARGIGDSEIELFKNKQILDLYENCITNINDWTQKLENEVLDTLKSKYKKAGYIRNKWIYMRFRGQENTLEIDLNKEDLNSQFKEAYVNYYGHWIENLPIEIESIKVVGAISEKKEDKIDILVKWYVPKPEGT